MRAHEPHQALRDDAVQRRGEAVGIGVHVQEAADQVEHVVGVHRREHEVAGERRLDGDLGRLRVADLAHHDLVRVVAQDRAQAAREGEPLLLVHRDLQHAGQLVLDRVLDGDDLVLAAVHLGERGVERGGLAAAGGTGDEEHAVGSRERRRSAFTQRSSKPSWSRVRPRMRSASACLSRIRSTASSPKMLGRIDTRTSISRPRLLTLKRPSWGTRRLRDVEIRHHLDARDDLLGVLAPREQRDLGQHAVDAVLDGELLGARLDVDVARAGLHRVVQRRVDELHDRIRVLADRHERQVLDRAFALGLLRGRLDRAVHGVQAFLVARQIHREIGRMHEQPFEGLGNALLGPGAQVGGEGVAEGEREAAVGGADRRASAARGVGVGQDVEGARRALEVGHGGGAVAERAGEPRDERTGAQARALLENVEHLAAAARGFAPGGADGLGVEHHCSAPASSRMGMYRSSTTAPITPPMRSIRIGSNRRVNHSTQRARSSSK